MPKAMPQVNLNMVRWLSVDNDMPVVILSTEDDMLDKLKSNMEEVQARGGETLCLCQMKTVIITIKTVSMWCLRTKY